METNMANRSVGTKFIGGGTEKEYEGSEQR